MIYRLLLPLFLIATTAPAMDHPPERPAGVTMGPWLQFTAPGKALVRWQTAEAVPSVIEYQLPGGQQNYYRAT